MRLFFCEGPVDYSCHHFSYRPMLELEPDDALSDIYARGFLPYSGDPDDERHLFYLARSLRWPLNELTFDKKHRYDFRRFETLAPDFEVFPKAIALERLPERWWETVEQWLIARFGARHLSRRRLDYILRKPFCSHIALASIAGDPFACVLLVDGVDCLHYWYAFFDIQRFNERSPGKWLMARTALWAGEKGFTHLYVGTGYGAAAAYKTRGVGGAQFFNGSDWSGDHSELRRRQAGDVPH